MWTFPGQPVDNWAAARSRLGFQYHAHMARIATRTLRRMRTFSACAALALGFVIATTTTREKGWHFGEGWFISIANASLQGGFSRSRLMDYDPIPPGPYTRSAWNTDYVTAWRPFHARDVYTGTPAGPIINSQFVVMPLWPLATLAIVALAYAHGRLSMLRDIRSGACVQCGYDLREVPARGGRRICPECGGMACMTAVIETGLPEANADPPVSRRVCEHE